MLMITFQSLAQPDVERPFMCFPVLVKNKYYHWILYGLLCLFSASIRIDLLCSILVAYIDVMKFGGKLTDISKEKIIKL